MAKFAKPKVANPSDPVLWCKEAAGRVASGDNRGAVFCYQESLKLRPGVPDVWFNVGCLYDSLGDTAAAKGCFASAEKMFPADFRFPAEHARLLAEEKKFSEAVSAVSSALEINPASPLLLANKAGYLIFAGDAAGALSAADAALAIDPVCVPAFLHKAHALVNLSRPAEALAVLEAGLAACPDEPRLLKMLSNVCIRLEEFAEGREYARRLLVLTPDDDEGCCLLGSACAYLGDRDGALAAFGQAVALKPKEKAYRANLAAVRKMK